MDTMQIIVAVTVSSDPNVDGLILAQKKKLP